jgi:hypothetical protein
MKLAFFLLGAALAVSAAIPSSVLTKQKEYRFAYDGYVSSGLPIASDSALTRLLADVRIQVPTDGSAILRLENLRLAASNSADPKAPFESFEKRELLGEHKDLLELPMHFSYVNGVASKLEFTKKDATWSANIKRAFVNMLQMNLNPEFDEKTESTEVSKDFWIVPEMTIEGDCMVAYSRTEDKGKTTVTKSVDFEKCTRRPDIRYNVRYSSECPECEQSGEMQSQSVYTYEIEKDELKSIQINSVHSVIIKDQVAMKTEIRTLLTLEETNDIKTPIKMTTDNKQHDLIYSTEWEREVENFFKNGDESEVKPFSEYPEKMEHAMKTVKEMSEHVENQPETVHLFARLVRTFRMSSMSELEKFHDKVYKNQDSKTQVVIEHALAVAGTKNTIEHLIRHIESGEISPLKASQLLKSIHETSFPSERIADLIAELANSKIAHNEPVLRQSAWLAYGAVVSGVVAPSAENHLIKENSLKIKQKFVHVMLKQLKKADSTYQKILAIKTLANAAVDISIQEIEKIIVDKKEHTSVRMEAIDAVRILSEQMPRKIQRIMMPVFIDRLETPEIRMAALAQIMHSRPAQSLIAQIIVKMEREPNMQIAAFTYRMLSSLAESTTPCLRTVAADVSALLRQCRFRPEGRYWSAYKHMSFFTQQWTSGLNVNVASVFGKDSVLPKELSASIDSMLGGNLNKYIAQIGFSQQNIEQIIKKVVEKIAEKEFDLEDSAMRTYKKNAIHEIKQLAKQMNIRARKNNGESAHAMIYLRYKMLDYAVLPIDEQIVDQFISEYMHNGAISTKTFERLFNMEPRFEMNHAAFFFETTQKIPTVIGLPLSVTAKMPTIVSAKGDFSVEKVNFGAKLSLKATPSVAATHVYQMRLWIPMMEHGVKLIRSVQLSAPINTNVEFNWKNGFEMIVRHEMPTEEKNVLSYNARPVCFFRFPNHKNINKYVEIEEKTIVVPKYDQINKEAEFNGEIFGMKIRANGNYIRGDWTLENILMGEQNMDLTLTPTSRTPKQIVARFNNGKITTGKISQPQTDKMTHKEFDVETNEDYESRDEPTRREQMHKSGSAISSQGYIHEMRLTLEAEKTAEIELRSEVDSFYRFFRSQLTVRVPSGERRDWTAKSVFEILFPEKVNTIKALKAAAHREIQIYSESKWGVEGENKMIVKAQVEQTPEQRQWLRMAQRELKGVPEYEMVQEAGRLNGVKIVADYQLTKQTENYFDKIFNMIKYSKWNNKVESIESDKRQVVIRIEAEPIESRIMNLTIQTPEQLLSIGNIDMPIYLPSIASKASQKYEIELLNKAECRIESTRISTFDEVIYRAPMTECYSVVAKDCSEQPKFAVLVKKADKKGDRKMVKIMSEKVNVELVLENGKMRITNNFNDVITIGEYKKFNIERISEKMYMISLKGLEVSFDGHNVKIEMSREHMENQCGLCGNYDGEKQNDFRTANDESTEDIQEFHRSFINKNEECKMDEMTLNDKSKYELLEESEEEREYTEENKNEKYMNKFESKWSDDSEEDNQKINKKSQNKWNKNSEKKWSKKSESSSSEEEDQTEKINEKINEKIALKKSEKKSEKKMTSQISEEIDSETEVETIEKTKVVEFSHRICFSTEPIPHCPKNTVEGKTIQKKVRFSCLARHEPEARRLLEQSKKTTQPLSLPTLPVAYVDSLHVPKACKAY